MAFRIIGVGRRTLDLGLGEPDLRLGVMQDGERFCPAVGVEKRRRSRFDSRNDRFTGHNRIADFQRHTLNGTVNRRVHVEAMAYPRFTFGIHSDAQTAPGYLGQVYRHRVFAKGGHRKDAHKGDAKSRDKHGSWAQGQFRHSLVFMTAIRSSSPSRLATIKVDTTAAARTIRLACA